VLRILVEKQLDLDLREAVRLAIAGHGYPATPAADLEQVVDYMLERFRAWYEDQGHPGTEVFPRGQRQAAPAGPLDIERRVHAVHAFSQLPEAAALAAANKRVSNLLAKSDASAGGSVAPALLREPAEQALAEAVAGLREQLQPLFAEARYTEALQQLAGLREQVDTFFDQVMVMTEDEALRGNRLALLAMLRELFLNVADISLLVLNQDER
jgi:glycyl-tRNA synthetase beta chain